VALLHIVRHRGKRLKAALGRRPEWITYVLASLLAVGCHDRPEPHLQPDELLQTELGLTLEDRIYRIRLQGGEVESVDPFLLSVEQGELVEFVTGDWLIHEVIFEADSLSPEQRTFLEDTDQMASPPLINRDSRYVLTFGGAPPGRYPYALEGNGRSGRGVIVVVPPAVR
jgi:plastocyanin